MVFHILETFTKHSRNKSFERFAYCMVSKPFVRKVSEVSADNVRQCSPEQLQYIEWLVSPQDSRVTQVEFARSIGVDVTTVRRWQVKEFFKVEWDKRVSAVLGSPERTQLLLDAVYLRGINGDVRAAQLFLQATNRLLPAPVVVNGSSTSDLSDSQLDELLESLARRESEYRSVARDVAKPSF